MPFTRMTYSDVTGAGPFRYRFDFDVAFQAIFDMRREQIWGYEALVRGPNGESAGEVIASIPAPALYAADQHCRDTAISLAANLGLTGNLSVNFYRGALGGTNDDIAATLESADRHGFPTNKIMFEFSETEHVRDVAKTRGHVNQHIERGFLTAMDDFGAGFQGLSLLCEVRPDIIKLDMSLIRNVDADPRRAKIVSAIVRMCQDLGICTICEGVETQAELLCLMDMGVEHFQGFLLARPQLARLLTEQQKAAAFAQVGISLDPAV